MATTPYTIERFGPLNLASDPLELGTAGATDLLNVDFDRKGRIRTRDGFTRLKAVTMDTADGLAAYEGVLKRQFIVGYTSGGTSTYAVYNAFTGALVTSTAVASGGISAARINVGGINDYMYLANGNGGDTIRRWDGSAFSSPAGMPKASYLAVTPKSDRLVAAVVASPNVARVQFSDAGAPETWTSTSWVDLPYGGGFVTGAEVWQDKLFVFKSSGRFFVFEGEGTDSTGQPIFNYRPVSGYSAWGSAVGDEGVFFSDGRTIWLTVGGIPTRISEPVEPYLRGLQPLNSESVDQDQAAQHVLTYSLGRLYVSVLVTGGTRRTLVYDPKLEAWTLYSLGVKYARALSFNAATSSILSAPRTIWLSAAGVELFDGAATDNGSSVTWSLRSGRYPVSDPGLVAVVRETSLDGYGTVTMSLLSDLYAAQSASATLGINPTVSEGWPSPLDQEGRWLQCTLSGTGQALVSRVQHQVSSVKPASAR